MFVTKYSILVDSAIKYIFAIMAYLGALLMGSVAHD